MTLQRTHKAGNPARIITSSCGTPTENLSYFVEKHCEVVVNSINSRVRDTPHKLEIINRLNDTGVFDEDVLVSFDIINMFRPLITECELSGYEKNL